MRALTIRLPVDLLDKAAKLAKSLQVAREADPLNKGSRIATTADVIRVALRKGIDLLNVELPVMCDLEDRGRPVDGQGCPEEESEEKSLENVLDRHMKIGQAMQAVGAKILHKVDNSLDLDTIKPVVMLMTTGIDIELKTKEIGKKFERLAGTREYIKTVLRILEKHVED